MFPSTFQRTMFPSFLGLHVTSSCSQPLEMRKRRRGEYTTARHTYNPFQSPTPGGKGRKGQKRRRGTESWEGEEDEHTIATQDPHPYLYHTPSPLIPTTHLPTFNTHPYHSHPPPSPFTLSIPPHHTSSHTLTTHLHHSPSPHPLTIHPHHPPLTFTTHPHPHHIPSPFTSTTHPPTLPLTLTTHPHHSPSPHTFTTHPHHPNSPLWQLCAV